MAKARALSYVKNVGKSIGYSLIDEIKESNPAIAAFSQTNASIMKDTYTAIKHLDTTVSDVSQKVLSSKYGELGKSALDNIKEDLKTGNFYNMERKKRDEDRVMSSMGMDFDDDFNFDFDDDSSFDSGDDDLGMEDMMDLVGKKSSESISKAIIDTAEYSTGVQTELARAAADQNKAIYANIHSGMSTINENLAKMVEIGTGPLTTHMENSQKFFETETKLSEERNSLLQELVTMQKNLYEQKSYDSGSHKYSLSEITDETGIPDLEMYLERIKQNVKSMGDGTMDMIKDMMDSGMLDTMISSPLKFMTDSLVKTIIPRAVKSSMKNFNKTIGGVFATSLAKLNNSDGGPVLDFIKNVFGIDDSVKSTIDTGNYKKGAVPFDGITRKSIVEVIPTHLARIEAALTKQGERRYDYQTGKFIDVKKIKDSYKNIEGSAKNMAHFDVNRYIDRYLGSMKIDDKQREKDLKTNIDKILDMSFRKGLLYDGRGNASAESLGLTGSNANNDLKIIQEIFKALPKHVVTQYAGDVFAAKNQITSTMKSREQSGDDIITAIFNNSLPQDEYVNRPSKVVSQPRQVDRTYFRNRGQSRDRSKKDQKQNQTKSSKQDDAAAASPIEGMGIDEKVQYVTRLYNQDPTEAKRIYDKEFKESERKAVDKYFKDFKKDNVFKKTVSNGGGLFGMGMPPMMMGGMPDMSAMMGDVKLDDKDIDKTVEGAASLFNLINTMESGEYQETLVGKLMEKIDDTDKVSDKTKKRIHTIYDFINKPAELLTGVIERADKALYNLVFGAEYDENGEKKSISQAITDGLKNTFNDFKEWMKKTIYHPIRDWFNEEGTIGNKIKNKLGIEFKKAKESDTAQRMKTEAGKAKDFVKDTVKGAAETVMTGGKKTEEDSIIEALQGQDNGNAASGMRKVKKTGVVAVSEGEMIIPPDMNPYNIEQRTKNENRAKKKFVQSLVDRIPGFAEGSKGISFKPLDKISKLKKTVSDWMDIYKNDKQEAIEIYHNVLSKEEQRAVDKSLKADKYSRLVKENAIEPSLNKIDKGANYILDAINRGRGKEGKSEKEILGEMDKEQEGMISNAMKEIKKFAPEVATGGLIGAGVSFVTGAIGGPLLGAAVGGGISLLRNSEALQDKLFGKKGEDGSRTGGLLPDNIANAIKKYAPSMAKGGTLGAILGFLPFTPGGPVAGILLGSALGFAKENDEIKEALFGKEGLIGEKGLKKIKDALPNMGLGAAAGLVAGPFGAATNIVLGAAAGYATSTDTFKDVMFGKIGEDDKRHGGVLETAVQATFKPLIEFSVQTAKDLIDWSKENIKRPLADAIDPIKKQFQLIGESIKSHLDNFFNEHLGAPIDKFIRDKVFSPITNMIKKATNIILAPLKVAVSAPFKLVGGIGNRLRDKQVRRGQADYMSADQRLAYRERRGQRHKIPGITDIGDLGRGKRFEQYDQALSNMGAQEANELASKLGFALDEEKALKHQKNSAYEEYDKVVRNNSKLTAGQVDAIKRRIQDAVKKGASIKEASKDAHKYINGLDGLTDDEKKQITKAVDKYLASVKQANERKKEFGNNKSAVIDLLKESVSFKEAGIEDISEKDLPKLLKYLQAEAKYKTAGKDGKPVDPTKIKGGTLPSLNEEQEKRHKDIIEQFEEINKSLSVLVKENTGRRDEIFRDLDEEIYDEDYSGEGIRNKLRRGRRKVGSVVYRGARGTVRTGIGAAKGSIKGVGAAYNMARDSRPGEYLFGDRSIDYRNLAAVSEGETILSPDDIPNYAEGGIVRDDNSSEEKKEGLIAALLGKVKGKKKKAEYIFTENGPIKIKETDQGEKTEDLADSETIKTKIKAQQKEEREKALVDKITNLPGMLLSGMKDIFSGKDDKKKESIFTKLRNFITGGDSENGGKGGIGAFLSGLLKGKGGTILAGVLGIPFFTGFIKETLGPKIESFINGAGEALGFGGDGTSSSDGTLADKIKEGVKDAANTTKDWLAGEGDFVGKGFPLLLQHGIEHWASGFEWIMGTVLPKVAEITVKCLPAVIRGALKGFGALMTENFHNVLNVGRPSTVAADKFENDDTSYQFSSITTGKGTGEALQAYTKRPTKWNTISSAFKPTSIDSGKSTSLSSFFNGNQKVSKEDAQDANELYNERLKNGEVKDFKSTKSYKSLKDFEKELVDKQIQDLTSQGKNVVSIQNENGEDEIVTLQELLTSNQVLKVIKNPETGEIQKLTGQDILTNPQLAGELGDASLRVRLNDEERQKRKEQMGLDKQDTLQNTALKFMGKSFLKGGSTPLMGKFGDALMKLPFGIGVMPGAALKGINKAADGSAALGRRILPNYTNKGGLFTTLKDNFFETAQKIGHNREQVQLYGDAAGEIGKTMSRSKAIKEGLEEGIDYGVTTGAKKGKLASFIEKGAGKAAGRKAASQAMFKEATEKTTEELAQQGFKNLGKGLASLTAKGNKGLIAKILDVATKGIKSLFGSSILKTQMAQAMKEGGKKASKEVVDKYAKELGEQITKKLIPKMSESLAKASGKVLGKLGATIASGGVLKLAFITGAFLSGWNNANNIMGIVDKVSKPSAMARFACAIVSALNEAFVMGLLPLGFLFDNIVLPLVAPLLKIDTTEIEEDRQASADYVAEENEELGTNMSVEEYNNQNKLTTKIKNKAKGLFETAKEGVGGVVQGVKKTGSKIAKGTKGVVDTVKEKSSNVMETAGKAIDNVTDSISDFGSHVGEIAQQSFYYATLKSKLSARNIALQKAKNHDANHPSLTFDALLGTALDNFLSPLRMIYQVGSHVSKFAKAMSNFGGRLKDQIKADWEQGKKDFNNGDLKGFLSFNTTEVDAEGNEYHNPLSPFRTAIKSVTRIALAGVIGVKYIGKGISNAVKGVVKGAKNSVLNLISSTRENVIDTAMHGSLGDYFNIFKGKDLSSPMGWLESANVGVQRITMAPVASSIYLGRGIVAAIKGIAKGGTAVLKNVGKNVKTSINIAKKGSLKEYLNIFKGNDTKTPLGWLGVGSTFLTRFFMAGPNVVIAAGSAIYRGIKGLAEGAKKTSAETEADQQYVQSYYEKDKMDNFWDMPSLKTGGFFGTLNKISGFIRRIVAWPIIKITNLIGGIHDWVDEKVAGVKKKFNDFADGVKDFVGIKDNNYDENGNNQQGQTAQLGTGGSGSGLLTKNLTRKHAMGSDKASDDRMSDGPEESETPTKISSNRTIREKEEKAKGTFISQIDKKYASKRFNVSGDTSKQTVGQAGCGPAAAAMVVNDEYNGNKLSMDEASKDALRYKVKDGGTNAQYFEKEFSKHGMQTEYIMDSNAKKRSSNIIRNLRAGNKVVLMGQNEANTTKANSPFGPNDHYVVATGLSKDGKRITINDPEAKRSNIEYDTSTILNDSSMGIAGYSASGSGITHKVNLEAGKVSAMGTKSTGSIASQVWGYLKSKGFTDQAAAGVMGNIQQESGMDPTKIQGNGKGPAAGLFQWENYNTKSGRWKSMYNFAKKRGKNWTDLQSQLDYMYHECTNGYEAGVFRRKYGGFSKLKSCTDINKACLMFEKAFERAGKPMMSTRYKYAKQYYNKFKGTMGTGVSGSSSSGFGGTNQQFLDICKDTAEYIVKDKWIYISASGMPQTWESSKKAKRKCTSCAHYVCLCMQRFGTLKPHEMFYSSSTGQIKYQFGSHKKSAEKHIKQYYDIIKIGGKKNYKKYLKVPGDICLWNGHTSVFAGFNSKGQETYYDFGRAGTSDGKPNSGYFTRVLKTGKQNHKLYWIFRLKEGVANSGGSVSSSSGEAAEEGTILDKILGAFDSLAEGYGLKAKSQDISTQSSSTDVESGDDNSNTALSTNTKYKGKYVDERQLQLVNKMTSWIGTLKYSQSGPRNPHKKSADCSSTTQYAYKDVLGVDPGSWSGGQFDNKNTYTVVSGKYDESKMQMGDLCLYKKGYGGSKFGHSDMYVGEGHVLSHGSSKRKGPNYAKFGYHGKPWKIRRWKGFKGKKLKDAKGSGILDYYDNLPISAMGSGLDYDDDMTFTDSIVNDSNTGKLQNQSKLITSNEKIPAGLFASGSGLEEVDNDNLDIPLPKAQPAKLPEIKFTKSSTSGSSGNASTTYKVEAKSVNKVSNNEQAYRKAIIKLLSKNVENTAMISTIVTILTELVKISEEERAIKNSNNTEQKRAELNARRTSMLNVLKSTSLSSTTDSEISKFIADAERLAKI